MFHPLLFLNRAVLGNDRKVKIGVDVIQQTNGSNVRDALKQLIDYEKFDITRGCLVRSKDINPKASVPRKYLKKLLHYQGGEWVRLQSEDIKELLAVWFVYNDESNHLTNEQIFDFVKQKLIVINNPLVREILSEPLRQQASNLSNDDLPVSIPKSVKISPNSIDDLKKSTNS